MSETELSALKRLALKKATQRGMLEVRTMVKMRELKTCSELTVSSGNKALKLRGFLV